MRSIIKRTQVQLDEAGAPRAHVRTAAAAAPPPGPTARVRLVQVDEHTQAIEFTCRCGEVSLIEIEKKP